ncbi:uncharacterized protein [Macrobrachium rosenbergii]|uniref:uncharacterized protein isoform X1 n=2 Tax=Macrobrachium rosenbergii TaxID=79674 RepID=UPI0034D4BA8A
MQYIVGARTFNSFIYPGHSALTWSRCFCRWTSQPPWDTMPGESHSDVPAAVPLQIAVQSASLSCVNGHSTGESEQPKTLNCLECKKPATIVCGGCWQAGFCARDHQLEGWVKHKPKCRPWRVASSDDLGRFMVATRDITPGELLIQDPPLLLGPKMITEPVCLGCYRPVDGSYQCKGCGFPMCDSQCEKSEDHKAECNSVIESGAAVKVSVFGEINSMYECITPLRIMRLRDENPMVWNKLLALESHSDKRDGTAVAAITQQTVVDIIHNRLRMEDFDAALIQKILGIIDTNAFEIRLPDSSILGVFSQASLLEHDCIANTHRTFDADLNLVVRAAIPIKRGDHLTSCYTDPLTTTSARLEHLRSSKYFTCHCVRCVDPTELRTFTSALKCSDCAKKRAEQIKKNQSGPPGRGRGRGRGGPMRGMGPGRSQGGPSEEPEIEPYIVPQDPLSPSSIWKCLSCGDTTTDDYPDRITSVVAEEAEELEAAPTVDLCEAFLEKWRDTFHSDHAILLNIKYVLLNLYGSEEGYELENLTPIQLARKEELCQQVLNVADLLLPGISRLRGSVLYELYQSKFYKAGALFKVGAISNDQAKKIASEAMTALKECARVLSYEPEVQPEGQLGLEAKDEIGQLEEWIENEGWKL